MVMFSVTAQSQTCVRLCTWCAHLSVSRSPHFIGCKREDGHRVAALHLSHDRVLTHSAQQLHAVYGWNKDTGRHDYQSSVSCVRSRREVDSHLSRMRLVSVLLHLTSCLNICGRTKSLVKMQMCRISDIFLQGTAPES